MTSSASTPVVSVLLPVYNGRATLRESVQSILQQTFRDFELLIIDDGSTDDSATLANNFHDARVRVLGDATRRGLAARLNEGIEAARGRYIARMDADDLAFSFRLERQVQFLDACPDIDLVGCRALVFREGGQVTGLLPFAASHAAICARPWSGFYLAHPTWMGRAAWFRKYRYAIPETKRAEDQELLLRSHATSRFACLGEILLAYRQVPFRLGKTLIARWHLLKAQERYFCHRREWKNTFLALAVTKIKILVDLLAALPGCEKLFFARMKGAIPPEALEEYERLTRTS